MTISTALHPRATLVLSMNGDHEMTAVMEQVPIAAAAKASGLHPDLIAQLIRYELLEGSRELVDLDQVGEIAEQIATARAPVDGQPILVSDGAELYGFTRPSVYNWIKGGWVRVLVAEPRVKVDQGDLAVARYLADKIGHVAGRAVFPPKPRSGRPRKS